MKIFIDFDDVIFNTGQFKHNFKEMFVEHGISGEIFDKYYNDPNDSRVIKTFDPWKQIERINGELGVDTQELTRLVNEYIADMSAYVFDDVRDFVRRIGIENICVLSFGEKEFQTKKITNSKIGDFMQDIIVTEQSKSFEIEKFLNHNAIETDEKIFFLDDRAEQIRDVKEKFPQIVTMLIKRPEGRYQEMQKENCCDYEAHNLDEAGKIIESKI